MSLIPLYKNQFAIFLLEPFFKYFLNIQDQQNGKQTFFE